MSEDTKKVTVEDLDFDSISGGVENEPREPGGSVLPPAPEAVLEATEKAVAPERKLSGWNLPIPTDSDRWVMTPIEDVTGDQFVVWACNVCPALIQQRLNPDDFDGPEQLLNKKQVVGAIGKYYEDLFSRKGLKLGSQKQ